MGGGGECFEFKVSFNSASDSFAIAVESLRKNQKHISISAPNNKITAAIFSDIYSANLLALT